MKKVDIDVASGPELRWFAENVLFLEDITQQTRVEKLRVMVKSAHSGQFISAPDKKATVPGAETQPAAAISVQPKEPAAPVDPEAEKDQMVSVIIATSELPGGEEPVWLAVNGVGQWVPRGEVARIRMPYFRVLENAVQLLYEPLKGGGMAPPREVHIYPFQRVSDAA